jgi:branched-chain amino acid transport system permease protein
MLAKPTKLTSFILIALAIALCFIPFIGGQYAVKFFTRVLTVALFVMSLDILIGLTGLVSFGHAAFFGLGAYAVWFVTPKDDGAHVLIALLAGVSLSGIAAFLIGLVAVRTKGFYFIMVTLAFSQMLFSLFHDTKIAGGSDGASINIKPEILSAAGKPIFELAHRPTLYFMALAALILSYLGLLWLARRKTGRVLQGIKFNENRMSSLGFNTYLYKLFAFTLAGALAGLAGALFAAIDGFIPPELMGWHESGLAIMMVVLGGVGTLYGAIFGAFIYSGVQEVLKSSSWVGSLIADHWSIPMGLFLIAAVLIAPKGLAGFLPTGRNAPVKVKKRASGKAVNLQTVDLSRHFGGLKAVEGVSLTFDSNKIHVVIGPNGAGKTTFINLLSGALAMSRGGVSSGAVDLSKLTDFERAKMGVGRSFQRTNILQECTVYENCLVAAERGGGDIDHALTVTGLLEKSDYLASSLSHGEQRQLEIAMLIASNASTLLLDEPLAGTGIEETARVTELLKNLAAHHTIILIEHDMDAVFAIADTIAVLVNGQLIAHGTPAEIKTNAKVREAYLGSYGEAAHA